MSITLRAVFLKSQSGGAKQVLSRMGGSTDSGLMLMRWREWWTIWDEARQSSQVADFASRTEDNGSKAMDRMRYPLVHALMLTSLGQ